MKLSVLIPCWSMNGKGKEVLEFSFKILEQQTFSDFEIIIPDHSIDKDIEKLCKKYNHLNIKYIRNELNRGSGSSNINLGLLNCSGEYIKLLCQDDYLYSNDSLEKCFNDVYGHVWGFNSYYHTSDKINLYRKHLPTFNDRIEIINTLGTPSALIIKNGLDIFMDENLKFCYDCEFYKRIFLKYGLPNISENVTMVNYIHENSTTQSIATDELRIYEENYIRRKFLC